MPGLVRALKESVKDTRGLALKDVRNDTLMASIKASNKKAIDISIFKNEKLIRQAAFVSFFNHLNQIKYYETFFLFDNINFIINHLLWTD